MIAAGDFGAKRNECKFLLKAVGLLESWETNPKYPNDLPSTMRSKSYREQWEYCGENGIFDAKLSDGTLVQFQREEVKLSYSLLVAPLDFPKFEDFAFQAMGEEWELVEEELREEFEVAASSEIIERPVTPIRYDYEPKLYRESRHPAGHFHFGIDNSIRVATRRVLNPVSFCLFVLRQCYPEEWENVKGMREFDRLCRQVRDSLPEVGRKKFKGKDHREAYIY